MANTRDLINNVLRGLRQFDLIIPDATTSTTDPYLLFILQMVNEAKEEIEDGGWPWQSLRTATGGILQSGVIDIDMETDGTSFINGSPVTNERSRLLYERVDTDGIGATEGFRLGSCRLPQVWNTEASSNIYRLREFPRERIARMHLTDDNQTGQPTSFAIWQDGDSLRIQVYPIPDAQYTITARIYIPQAALTATDLDTVLTIPSRPVYLLALLKANAERGSELGAPDSTLAEAAADALGAAVDNEMTDADRTVTLDR